jgi:hypothetical protein
MDQSSGGSRHDASLRTWWMRAVGAADLRPAAKLVAWAIGAHMNAEGSCFPSLNKIGEATGTGVSAVKRWVPKIERAGLLSVQRGGGRGRVNTYQAQIPAHLWASIDPKGAHQEQETSPLARVKRPSSGPRSSSEVHKEKGARVPFVFDKNQGPTPLYHQPFCRTCSESHEGANEGLCTSDVSPAIAIALAQARSESSR